MTNKRRLVDRMDHESIPLSGEVKDLLPEGPREPKPEVEKTEAGKADGFCCPRCHSKDIRVGRTWDCIFLLKSARKRRRRCLRCGRKWVTSEFADGSPWPEGF